MEQEVVTATLNEAVRQANKAQVSSEAIHSALCALFNSTVRTREHNALTAQAISKETGVDVPVIAAVFQGAPDMDRYAAGKIANYLGYTATGLFQFAAGIDTPETRAKTAAVRVSEFHNIIKVLEI